MRISCAAKYCKNKSYNCNLKFFNFPMEARAQIWLIACGREDLLHKGVNLFKYKICSAHFEKKHFNVYRLKSDAVPTLFPTMESSSLAEHSYCQAINDSNNVQGIPKNCELRSSSLNDHSYCRASPELDCNTGQEHTYTKITEETEPPTSLNILENILMNQPIPIEKETHPTPTLSKLPTPTTTKYLTSKSTQTSLHLSANTPRKNKLRKSLKKLRNENLYLNLKVAKLEEKLREHEQCKALTFELFPPK